MSQKTGTADLPLHGGKVPAWLAHRMAALGRVLVEALVLHYGRQEVLRRLSHPFWFQAFGAVMGMDWHSSGITTTVVGALKRGLAPVADELGIYVCGGRGAQSKKVPDELRGLGDRLGLDAAALVRASRLAAKVDNAAVQDGFQLYLHGFIVAADGNWAVVQQGMAGARHLARRYHWLSEGLQSFVDAPHTAIEGEPQGEIINLADRRAAQARAQEVALVRSGPDEVLRQLRSLVETPPVQPRLILPAHHEVRPGNVVERRLHGVLAAAQSADVSDFEALLLVPGLGERTLATLALLSEVLHGAPSRFSDPARFSLALGGKDGQPFPVPLHVYDAALRIFREAVQKSKLGRDEQAVALKRLHHQALLLEQTARGPGVAAFIEAERARSHQYGGMSVAGPAKPPIAKPKRKVRGQLALGLVWGR